MDKGNTPMIVAAHAGTGKTTLAATYPERVTDFVAMPYKYHLEDDDNVEPEKSKANLSLEMQWAWPHNYVAAIKEEMARTPGKIIVIPSDWKVRKLLEADGIPYTLCYPRREDKEVYRERFLERGNNETFMDIFIGGWDRFLDLLEGDTYGTHIVLQPHEFLSDVIDVEGIT